MSSLKLSVLILFSQMLTGGAIAQSAAEVEQEAQLVEQRTRLEAQRTQIEEERKQIEAQRSQIQAEQTRTEAEVVAARAKLEAARAELERAAQEVARLSAQRSRPWSESFVFNEGFIGPGRPVLGLNIQNDEDGVRIIGVTPNGPAQEAGVQIGDLIVSIDGTEVDGSSGSNPTRLFLDQLGQIDAGAEVELELLRDGESLTIQVETDESAMPGWLTQLDGGNYYTFLRNIPRAAERAAERGLVRVMERPFLFGAWSDMELIELTPGLGSYFGTEEGLLVVRAPSDDEIDLRDGDVILQIGGRTPQSVGHAMRILRSFEPGESLELTIMRDQRRRTLEIDVPGTERDVAVEID